MSAAPGARALEGMPELWAGPAGSIVRVGERRVDQLDRTGFAARLEGDLERIASLRIARVRLPLPWERIAPDGLGERDWRAADRCMQCLRDLGVAPVVGLLDHGSGPRDTGLLDPSFAAGLAAHARAVAERFPDIALWTPVQAPVTTARLSALQGLWHPQHRSDASFVRAVLAQLRATVLAMRAVRAVNPQAMLLQTEDIGLTQSALRLRYHAEFLNLRRWLAFDLLCGRVDRSHRMWRYLRKHGAGEAELMAFVEAPCPPDMLGVDVQPDSDRFLDERLTLYPRERWSGNGRHRFIDNAAWHVQGEPIGGFEARLREAWQRYRLPLAVSATQLRGPREEQMRWLHAAWAAACTLRGQGADVRAVTAPPAFGADDAGDPASPEHAGYTPGLWDVRAPEPRPTALAAMARALARDGRFMHPVLEGPGAWLREQRFALAPHGRVRTLAVAGRPLLVVNGSGLLGRTLVQACELRGLACQALGPGEPASIAEAITRWQPWAVVDAGGAMTVDDSGPADDTRRAEFAATLARACAAAGLRLLAFSGAQVFDGAKQAPYVESDAPAPRHPGGEVERIVLAADPAALLVRTGALFGPADGAVARLAAALRQRQRFAAATDRTLSPTYAPQLADAALDLLLDGMRGIVHLANAGAVDAAGFMRMAADAAGLDGALIDALPPAPTQRPAQAALASERLWVMPTLEEAVAAFARDLGRLERVPQAPASDAASRTRRRAPPAGATEAAGSHR